MPATSHKQEVAARMALAARHGDIPMSKLHASSRQMSKMPASSLGDFTHMQDGGGFSNLPPAPARGGFGVASPGLTRGIGGLGAGQMPSGLPKDFYRPPGSPPGPRPQDYLKPSPSEQRIEDQSPEMFGRPVAGLLHSDVPGRTDQLPVSVSPGAYVVPADVVSGLGQGNTKAGAVLLSKILPQQLPGFASGGEASPDDKSDPIPIVAAGGEYVVPPETVKAIGGGDIDKGHDILDKMVRNIRVTVAKQMMKLPGPKRD